MTTREQFQEVLTQLNEALKETNVFSRTHGEAFNEQSKALLKEAFHEKFPKRRFNLNKVEEMLGRDVVDAILAPLVQEFKDRREAFRNLSQTLQGRLLQLAPGVVPSLTEEPRLFDVCPHSAYSSQTDAEGYAQGKGLLKALPLKKAGIPYEIRKGQHRFEVWAKADEVSLEATKLTHFATEDDFVDVCYENGLNPLVYRPWARDLYEKWLDRYQNKDKRCTGHER